MGPFDNYAPVSSMQNVETAEGTELCPLGTIQFIPNGHVDLIPLSEHDDELEEVKQKHETSCVESLSNENLTHGFNMSLKRPMTNGMMPLQALAVS